MSNITCNTFKNITMEANSILISENNAKTLILLPAIVVVSFYLLIGLFGNPLIVLYYSYHGKPSPSSYFIVAMAIFDLMICFICMPMEIVDMCFTYMFPSRIMCKLFRFVNYFASISSGCILIAIAVDRYKKVCQPFKKQITTNISKLIIIGVSVFSFCVSCPGFVVYELETVNTTKPGIVGYDCTTIRSDDYKLYILVFNGVCFLIFIALIVTLIVLYILIGRKLVLLKRFRYSAARPIKLKGTTISTPPTSSSEIDSLAKQTENIDLKHFTPIKVFSERSNGQNSRSNRDLQDCSVKIGCKTDPQNQVDNRKIIDNGDSLPGTQTTSKIEAHCIQDAPSPTKRDSSFRRRCMARSEKKSKSQYIHLRKYTMLMFSIAIAFIISFVPYLGIVTWRALVQTHEGTLFTDDELVVYNIVIRSWILSSVVNPFIYGFFNPDFRLYIWYVFRQRLCFCIPTKSDVWQREATSKQESSQQCNA